MKFEKLWDDLYYIDVNDFTFYLSYAEEEDPFEQLVANSWNLGLRKGDYYSKPFVSFKNVDETELKQIIKIHISNYLLDSLDELDIWKEEGYPTS